MAEGTCYLPNGEVSSSGRSQAACQAGGGTWVASGTASPVQDDRGMFQKAGSWIAENPIEAASYGLIFGGPAAWGIKGAMAGVKALRAGGALKGRIGKFMDKTFRKEGTPANPGFVLPKGVSKISRVKGQKGFDYSPAGVTRRTFNTTPLTGGASAASRVMRRPSRNTMLGVGGAGLGMGGLYYAGADERESRTAAINANIEKNILEAQKGVDTTAKTAAEAKAEKERVANLGFFDRMKEPGYWDKSMSGDPHDTRLSRIAQLTSYLGKTPKLRALEKNPQDRWSEQAQSDASAQTALLKAQATLFHLYA